MGIFTKGINPGAYRGKLTCPRCNSEALRYVENVTQFRLRYRCRKCGQFLQYDISNSPIDAKGNYIHPYAPYTRQRWQKHVIPGA
jgi:transcription elongation factor Elf1